MVVVVVYGDASDGQITSIETIPHGIPPTPQS